VAIRSALLVGQDNLLEECSGIRTDFISTGRSLTPGYPDERDPFFKLIGKVFIAFIRAATGRYDLIILPVVRLSWPYDRSAFKRHLRKMIRVILAVPIRIKLPRILKTKTRVIFIDRFDSTDIFPELPTTLGADIYFKTNYISNSSTSFSFKILFLPYWLLEKNYPDYLIEKKSDLFYCARSILGARENISKELAMFADKGISIDHPKDRIPFPEFVKRMGEAILTLSPSGVGYHGYRHYEAMLMGSVPILDRNNLGMETDLVDGKTCLLYEDGVEGDLARIVTEALRNKEALIAWGNRLRRFACENHSLAAVGHYEIARVEEISR
jgi:glycosyltransferase involved in cell wall biosynthesis